MPGSSVTAAGRLGSEAGEAFPRGRRTSAFPWGLLKRCSGPATCPGAFCAVRNRRPLHRQRAEKPPIIRAMMRRYALVFVALILLGLPIVTATAQAPRT